MLFSVPMINSFASLFWHSSLCPLYCLHSQQELLPPERIRDEQEEVRRGAVPLLFQRPLRSYADG